jgi:hypothetical protein
MDLVLKNLAGTECWLFIDDVIVYSDIAEKHANKLTDVFERFKGIIYNFNQRTASLLKTRFHT